MQRSVHNDIMIINNVILHIIFVNNIYLFKHKKQSLAMSA